MNIFRDAGTTRTAGSLRLHVRYDGEERDDDVRGFRSRYAYSIISTDPDLPGTYKGNDLLAGHGTKRTSEDMVRELASFLNSAADRGNEPAETGGEAYPAWLHGAVVTNRHELDILQLEQDDIDQGRLHMRYRDVAFQEGEDARDALWILDARGEEAAVEHLIERDGHNPAGQDAEDYDELPVGQEDRVYANDTHVLSYNLRREYIGLLRKLVECDDPPAHDGAAELRPSASRTLSNFAGQEHRRDQVGRHSGAGCSGQNGSDHTHGL